MLFPLQKSWILPDQRISWFSLKKLMQIIGNRSKSLCRPCAGWQTRNKGCIKNNRKSKTTDFWYFFQSSIPNIFCHLSRRLLYKGGISLISKSTQPLKCRRHLHSFLLYSLFYLFIAFQRKETCSITRIRPWFFFLFRSRFHPWIFS